MYTAAYCRYVCKGISNILVGDGVGSSVILCFNNLRSFRPPRVVADSRRSCEINHFVLCLEFIIIVNMQHFVTYKY